MKIDLYHHFVLPSGEVAEINRKLDQLIEIGEHLMATQTQHAQRLNDLSAKVSKIGAETEASLKLIKDLKDAQAAAGNITPEVQAATDALEAQLTKVDDMVPDAPAPGGGGGDVPPVV